MDPLQQPDLMHLSAAQGWLELGNSAEASGELNQITPVLREHPEVLQVRWQVAVKDQRWPDALAIAETICRLSPESPFGWIHRSYCYHELKRTQEAWDALLPVVERFPDEWLIAYNLACYACQLGRAQESRTWLKRALELGKPEQINRMAAKDPDLQPLFEPRG
jgi:tetratricopeptide (TPR) repeat protein